MKNDNSIDIRTKDMFKIRDRSPGAGGGVL